ncbi:MAG: hypothetical protein U0T75_16040 [Chitinophagales bacterium]
MKKAVTPLLLLLVIVSSGFRSQRPPEDDNGHYKNNGYFFAILNGNMFEMRDDDKYRAELVNKTGSMKDDKLSRAATSLIFYGNDFKDENGKLFTENVEMEYTFDNGALGEPHDLKIEAHYDKQDFYHIPEATRFKIIKIDWSDDHTNFLLSADFDCKMRRWGFPAESQPTIRIKGRMVNINVTVPSWVKIKDPTQVAGR